MDASIASFYEMLEKSERIVFFGGAGVSTESGIPDFRSSSGLYMEEAEGLVSPEEAVSGAFLKNHPKSFFDYYFNHLVHTEAEPNSGHKFLFDLERQEKDVTIITQNIDGLHQKAGSSRVLELHGSVWHNHCVDCARNYDLSELQRDEDGIPRCPFDKGIVRPDIVLYGEGLNQETLFASIEALTNADMVIIAGTSLVVYPAAGLVDYYTGNRMVLINNTPVTMSKTCDIVFEQTISSVISELKSYQDQQK